MDAVSSVAAFFKSGGPFMYVILATAVVILAVVVERTIVLARFSALNAGKLADDLVRNAQKGDFAAALNLVKGSRMPGARVATAILETGSRDENTLQNAADGAATLALPPLAKRLPYLNMLANVATLLGLLGTIFGLTTAFSAVGAADPSQRSAFLAAGISQALNTTALGLIIAVPTLLIHGFLVNRVESIVEQVDEISIRLIRALTMSLRPSGSGVTVDATRPAAHATRVAAPGHESSSGMPPQQQAQRRAS
jgi:biopolymer transport protein ExbB/TolQ